MLGKKQDWALNQEVRLYCLVSFTKAYCLSKTAQKQVNISMQLLTCAVKKNTAGKGVWKEG